MHNNLPLCETNPHGVASACRRNEESEATNGEGRKVGPLWCWWSGAQLPPPLLQAGLPQVRHHATFESFVM